MRIVRLVAPVLFLLAFTFPASQALEKQPASDYHARRVALGDALHGGVAILFAAEEPVLDFDPYRQDSDFYYLTGWNEPGAALMIIGPSREQDVQQAAHPRDYKEILFLPTRNLRMEQYTGAKMDAATPGRTTGHGVDNVEPMTNLAADLNKLIARRSHALPPSLDATRRQGCRISARLHGRDPRLPLPADARCHHPHHAAARSEGLRRN